MGGPAENGKALFPDFRLVPPLAVADTGL